MPDSNVRRESFFVGGRYVGPPENQVMQGQMYVERLVPAERRYTLPLVFVHGNAQTAMNWISTPDGRAGWAQWFVEQGWEVFLIDQPGRGRSAWQPGHDGELKAFPVHIIEALFTACADGNRWPQAKLHTQWPGGNNKGRRGDPVFDQFFASQVPSLDRGESQILMRSAGAALLDRIGPAILIGHSQGAGLNWLIGDERPDLVKAIIALEPNGPPYKDASLKTGAADRLWGLTSTPLAYSPDVTEQEPLQFVPGSAPTQEGRVAGWLQREPARRLTNLAQIPVLLVTAEASYHAAYDHCTVDYLRQAGVSVDFMRLEEAGIEGNGHMMMLEKNSFEIASLLDSWIRSKMGH